MEANRIAAGPTVSATELDPRLVSRAIDAPVPWNHANESSETPILR